MSQKRKKWSSVNNVGIFSDFRGPRKIRKETSTEPLTNGEVNGEAEHGEEGEIPNVEAPMDNEEVPAEEVEAAAADGEAPAAEEPAADDDAPEAAEEEEAVAEEPEAEEPAAVEEAVTAEEEEAPVAEGEPPAEEEAPVEEELNAEEEAPTAADEPEAEEQPPDEPAAEEPVPDEPADEEPGAEEPTAEEPAPDAEPVVEELATVEEEDEPQPTEAEEDPATADEAADLTQVPEDLVTADGTAAATKGRTIEKVSDELAKTFIRGKPIVMRIPPDLRETWDPEAPLEKPPLEFQLEWVYGYRGQIDGHGNPNLYYLPTGEIVYYVAAVVVLYNLESHTQRHYTGHTNDIHCIAIHPYKPFIATGQAQGHSKITSTVQQSHVQVCSYVSTMK